MIRVISAANPSAAAAQVPPLQDIPSNFRSHNMMSPLLGMLLFAVGAASCGGRLSGGNTLNTTSAHAHTFPWRKTRQFLVRYNLRNLEKWWNFRKSAGSITDTNAARSSLPGFVHLNLSETTLRSAATNFPRVCVRKYRVRSDRSELFASVSQQLFKTPTGLLIGTACIYVFVIPRAP